MTARYLTDARLHELARTLSERDRKVIKEVAALRFVSGAQLAHLCFARTDAPTADIRAARRALLRLNQLQVLGRLPRSVGGVRRGSAGFIYHLAPTGQSLAMHSGWLPRRRTRAGIVPGRLFVRHALAVAELHSRLVEAEGLGQLELLERAAEPACWRSLDGYGQPLKPDSYIRLGLGDFEDSYFIEVDRGTEGSRAIERQLERYLAYHRSGREQAERGVFPKVLWLAPDAARVASLREIVGRLSADERELFAVAHFENALSVLASTHPDN
jgi:hypothetical protein